VGCVSVEQDGELPTVKRKFYQGLVSRCECHRESKPRRRAQQRCIRASVTPPLFFKAPKPAPEVVDLPASQERKGARCCCGSKAQVGDTTSLEVTSGAVKSFYQLTKRGTWAQSEVGGSERHSKEQGGSLSAMYKAGAHDHLKSMKEGTVNWGCETRQTAVQTDSEPWHGRGATVERLARPGRS